MGLLDTLKKMFGGSEKTEAPAEAQAPMTEETPTEAPITEETPTEETPAEETSTEEENMQ